ncbi:TIGR03086 family metal-binding protein [Nocardia sp. BMG51109]|uniref:TIGR03086 family metal-binding protein n=1 Tax=Nocardia sp. BMG51109 TaxID=1056816 RepID=UPI00046687A8|nr:TIGR03086 family metal-binding protein [Nocardia sp. BMG51109]
MIDLKPACHTMIELLADVSDELLGRPTPCAEYTVADLVDHIVESARGFIELAGRAAPPPGDRAAQVAELGEAWADPAAWTGTGGPPQLRLPNELWGRIALTEMVVHGWDLAVALGRPFHLPEETLRACLDHVTAFVPEAPLPELWGSAVDAPATAPLIDRIVAVTGRDPHWTPARAPFLQ